ncbi:MAG: DUF2852 domain-containing protein, partial [Hyphomicrobium sp.]
GFVLFFPVGLAILAYLLWSGRMSCGWNGRGHRWQSRFADTFEQARSRFDGERSRPRGGTSGNKAFDEYRAETLRRLEDEEREFRSFLERLRQAKDKSEFDAFMTERRHTPPAGSSPSGDAPAAP